MELLIYENHTNNITFNNPGELDELLEIGEFIKSNLGLIDNPFKYSGNGTLYVAGIVGILKCGDTSIKILPKYKENTMPEELLLEKLLVRTIICSGKNIDGTIFYNKKSLEQSEDYVFDFLGRLFYKSIHEAIKKMPITSNVQVIGKSGSVKGKILIQRQISEAVFDGKIWCKYKQNTNDNYYNKLLCWGCTYLSESSKDVTLKRTLKEMAKVLNIDYDDLNINIVKNMILPRKFSDYKVCFDIAKNLYLNRNNLEYCQVRGNEVTGFAIAMSRAFEYIVEYYVNKVAKELNVNHYPQSSKLFAKENTSCRLDYCVRPDNILIKNSNHIVLDAKYKVLLKHSRNENKPNIADIYQMVCSCIAYHCSEAILIYPETFAFPTASWNTAVEVNGNKINIKSASIDILKDDNTLKEDVLKIIKDTDFMRR